MKAILMIVVSLFAVQSYANPIEDSIIQYGDTTVVTGAYTKGHVRFDIQLERDIRAKFTPIALAKCEEVNQTPCAIVASKFQQGDTIAMSVGVVTFIARPAR